MKRFKKKLKKYNDKLFNLYSEVIYKCISNDYYEYKLIDLNYKLVELITFGYYKNVIDFDELQCLINAYNKLFRVLAYGKDMLQVYQLMGSIEHYINTEID